MTLEEIYKEADILFIKELMINNEAMKMCQSLGLNGFKRWHRILDKFFNEKSIELENSMFDNYRKVLDVIVASPNYKPLNFKSHIASWKSVLEADINKLGELNKAHIDKVGISCKIIECVIEKLKKTYEKVCRYEDKFSKVGWTWDYTFYEDNLLHDKCKKIEEGE